ncbi:MAG: glycosyltransferase family 39 protein [Thainema sp.]
MKLQFKLPYQRSPRVWKRLPIPAVWTGLIGLWLFAILIDVIWLKWDQSIASWDPADHLIGSLNYWWTLVNSRPLDRAWWDGVWTLSSKYPPLLYLSTVPFRIIFGTSADAAVLVNTLYTGILLGSVYGLGRHLFSARVGLWAAGLCLLLPQFYSQRVQYFMDYPLVALVALSFWLLSLWRDADRRWGQWLIAIAVGLSLGLGMLMKQTAVIFFIVPLLWVMVANLRQRRWERLGQIGLSLLLMLLVIWPWLSTNWFFQISAVLNANVQSAINEGDPPLHTLGAWTYYWADLPRVLSWPLLIVPLVGLILAVLPWFPQFQAAEPVTENFAATSQPARKTHQATPVSRSLRWLLAFMVGAYLLWSAVFNKDPRYVMPYLSGIAVLLAYGLTRWPSRWSAVRWATVGCALGLMLLSMFPVGGQVGQRVERWLSPQTNTLAQHDVNWPHAEIIQEIYQTQPYQVVNLGVLPSSAEINQHNLTYYGNAQNFRVYARRMGDSKRHLDQDLRSLPWFLSWDLQSANHRSLPLKHNEESATRILSQSPLFQKQRSWTLPDGHRIDLYRHQTFTVDVQPVEPQVTASLTVVGNGSVSASEIASAIAPSRLMSPHADLDNHLDTHRVQLQRLTVPNQAAPGDPLPITYEWIGSWGHLSEGLVLLTWQNTTSSNLTNVSWIHDHGLGFGGLHPKPIQAQQTVLAAAEIDRDQIFSVIERTATLPPADLPPGQYRIQASYWNPKTGETYAIPTPATTVTLRADAPALNAPELDWVTQLRTLAPNLALGQVALDPIFDQLGRINVYDPIQHYLVDAEQTLAYRLQQEPQNLGYAYGMALAAALQLKVEPAIAALERVVQLDADNPYAHAYLGFVNLYGFHPRAATQALDAALRLKPDSAEIQGLSAIAALMQGNFVSAWQHGKTALELAQVAP